MDAHGSAMAWVARRSKTDPAHEPSRVEKRAEHYMQGPKSICCMLLAMLATRTYADRRARRRTRLSPHVVSVDLQTTYRAAEIDHTHDVLHMRSSRNYNGLLTTSHIAIHCIVGALLSRADRLNHTVR